MLSALHKAHIIIHESQCQLLFQDKDTLQVWLYHLGEEESPEAVQKKVISHSVPSYETYTLNNLRAADSLYSVTLDDIVYIFPVVPSNLLPIQKPDVLDFLEMQTSGDIFFLYSDRFEIESQRFDRVYKVYRNRDFSLYRHINLSFDYDYVNNFLVIQQNNQIAIL